METSENIVQELQEVVQEVVNEAKELVSNEVEQVAIELATQVATSTQVVNDVKIAAQVVSEVAKDVQVVAQVVNDVAKDVQVVAQVVNDVATPTSTPTPEPAPTPTQVVIPQKILLVHYSSPKSLIFTVCGQVSHILGKKTIRVNKSNIISLIHTVMGAIETVNMTTELKGKEKKDLAIDCLNWFVDQEEDLSLDEKALIHQSITLIAPDAIDVIAEVGNGLSDLVKNGLVKTKICCTFL
jgi:hypothetical protein